MRVPRSLSALLALSLSAPVLGAQDLERARKLFVTNCAACHGESGDGKGTTELDRPARSFQDGGFSFGNTPEALFKTISTGIPGSPMAGFEGSLTEEERHLVAAYVVTLGPPITEVSDADMILAVKDKPLIVRGLLPSLGEGLPQTPRGLLIGDPSGITFEYRVDDVRLLALRQGGFVKRTDWTGRGGTELEPLGKAVQLVEGGKPEASFWSDGKALEARFSGTKMQPLVSINMGAQGLDVPKLATLEYHLFNGKRELAHVAEIPFVSSMSLGTGYVRWLSFEAGAEATTFTVRTPRIQDAIVLARGKGDKWIVVRPPGGTPTLFELGGMFGPFVIGPGLPVRGVDGGRLEAVVKLEAKAKAMVGMMTLPLVDWNEQIAEEVRKGH